MEAFGDTLVDFRLLGIEVGATDLRPALKDVAESLIKNEQRRFRTQGGGDWAPLAPATRKSKAARGEDPRILHATGRLAKSLTRKHDPWMQLDVGPNFLVYGSHVPYAGFHQTGTRHMPPRKPLRFGEAEKAKAIKTLQRALVEGSRGK